MAFPGEAVPHEPRVETDSPVFFTSMPVSRVAEPTRASSSDYVEIVHNKLRYSIYTMQSGNVATLLGWVDSNDYTPHLVIPDYVPYGNEQVPVTTVNTQAFYGGSGITALTIGANVKTICAYAFFSCEITELTIPTSVTSIEEFAFSGNPFTELTFENAGATLPKLYMGKYALAVNNLTTFEVPARMAIEGEFSFAEDHLSFIPRCHSLRSLTINPAYGSDLSAGAPRFEIIEDALCITSGTGAGRKVSIVTYPIANGKKSVSITDNRIDVFESAFEYAPMESIAISATSPKINGEATLMVENYAFSSCDNLSTLSLSANGPIYIGPLMAILSPSLAAYTLGDNITNYKVSDGVLYTTNGKILVSYPPGKKDREFTIPDNVSDVYEYSFVGHQYITKLTLPQGLFSIGTGAFQYSSRLKDIIYSGSGLTYIYKDAFYRTPFIDEAPAGPVMLGDWMVAYSGAVPQDLVIGPEVRHAVQSLFYNNQDIRSVVLPDNMEIIPQEMFRDCQNLTKVTWPANLKKIHTAAFYHCDKLESANLPEGVIHIMPYAFAYCNSLHSISLPSTLSVLGDIAFYQAKANGNTIEEVAINRATPPSAIELNVYEPTTDLTSFIFFSPATKAGATLVLPQGVDPSAFTRYEPWRFANVENRDLGGIGSVTADNGGIDVDGLCVTSRNGQNLELWRMDGIKLASGTTVTAPCAGIYLLRQASATTKLKLSPR